MKTFTNKPAITKLMRVCFFAFAFTLFTNQVFSQIGWTQFPSISPGSSKNSIRGISGTSSTDIWAVGYFSNTSPTPEVIQDFIIHWDGNTWQQYPPFNPGPFSDLYDVEAISANNVWAVGSFHNIASNASKALLLHYNGSSWTNQPLPTITGGSYLRAIHATSPTDIWATGNRTGTVGYPPYVIHYNGSSWTEISVPSPAYHGVFWDINGIANDLWAVGWKGATGGDRHSLAMHWNGSSWSEVSLPPAIVTPLTRMVSVKMISPNDVWAMGIFLGGGKFTIHWNGTAWSVVNTTSGGALFDADLAAVSTNNVFSVATEISNWNGTTWSIVDSLTQHTTPYLHTAVVFSNGDVWAGGIAFDPAANKYVTLVYRTVNHIPQFAGGNTQSWNVATNTTNNSPGNLMLTLDPDISQILTYTIVTPPSNGTISGLPTTAITNNGSALPTGIGYTPATGYLGTDQFVVRVSVGPVSALTTINVNVFSPLPVTLIDFQVSKQGAYSLLKWSTATETNAKTFEVEYSRDGNNFNVIGNVPTRGNSTIVTNYSFTHKSPVPGNNFYRIKLIDQDGKTTLFPVRHVQFDAATLQPVTLLINPVKNNEINLQVNTTGALQLNIYNMQGQKLLGKMINNTSAGTKYTVNLLDAGKGIYIMEIDIGQLRYSVKLLLE